MVVQHNLRAMNSNRMLGLTTSVQSKSTEKLSSGYKINRAADDAAGLSISEKMRKQIRGLSQASLNAADGISAVQTAEGALNEVQDMLQRMNELAVKASNGTMSENDRGYIQDEIDQLITEIDRVAETTKFNETYLLKGDDNGEKAVAYNYAEKSDFLKDGAVLFTKNIDGSFTQVADGALLDDEKEYYSTYATTTTTVGEKIDFTKGQIVGTQLDSASQDSADYFTAENVVTASGMYTYNSSTKVYEAVDTGDVYNDQATYYSMSTNAQGEIKYAAIEDSDSANYVDSSVVVASGKEVWDSNGEKYVAGDFIDSTKPLYKDISATKDTTSYVTKTKIIDEDGLYIKDSTGNYKAVKKGDEYDSDATYYSMTDPTATGKVTDQAVEKATVTTKNGYEAAVDMYDSDGSLVSAGTTIDTSKEYYSSVKTSETYSGTAVDPSALSNYKEDPGTFRFVDADGNTVAENGLYRFFDEDEKYSGGLFVKNESGELEAADSTLVNAYVESGEAETGTLKLALHVGADATVNNQITINIEAMDADTLGITGIKVDGADDTNARSAIDVVKEALQKVSTQRSALGAVQNRLEHTIANLDNVVENTTAAESQIRDTDMATEMVKYSNNNILAQAGQAMLAQANQANQGVLSLLG